MLAVLLTALVASTSFTVVLVPGPADADQITDLKAQATALSQKLVEEQLQVGAYEQQYSVATAKTAADARAIARLDAADRSGTSSRSATRPAPSDSRRSSPTWTTAVATSGADSSLFSGNQESVQAASEYSGIAVGNITTAIDQLRTAQRTLQSNEAALQQQQQRDQSDQAREASFLGQADDTEHQLEASRAQVTGQLAVGRGPPGGRPGPRRPPPRWPRHDAAPARARVPDRPPSQTGARDVGAPRPDRRPLPPAASGGGTPGLTDPALNPFLQCVVQAESGGNYGAVSPNGLYMGAFQFSQSTWNFAAQAAGLPSLIGVHPNLASKAEQDTVAVALYALDGEQPWLGDRCSS